jgi:NADPH-dependent ferric siderophore reductase
VTDALQRVRREPPRFRRVEVRRLDERTPRLTRVTLAGPELEGLAVDEPAASVRLLLPSPGSDELVIPAWKGNEFLLADGSRPVIRTLTPRRVDPDAGELDVEIVRHGSGQASAWVADAGPGAPAAVSGPGRGYSFDPEAAALLLAGDETAIPAISQLLEVLPAATTAQVHIEVADPVAELPLPADVSWHVLPDGEPPGTALVAAVRAADIPSGAKVWAAGEAAAMQRIRKHLSEERGLSRRDATVRGYWKVGRAGDGDGD